MTLKMCITHFYLSSIAYRINWNILHLNEQKIVHTSYKTVTRGLSVKTNSKNCCNSVFNVFSGNKTNPMLLRTHFEKDLADKATEPSRNSRYNIKYDLLQVVLVDIRYDTIYITQLHILISHFDQYLKYPEFLLCH